MCRYGDPATTVNWETCLLIALLFLLHPPNAEQPEAVLTSHNLACHSKRMFLAHKHHSCHRNRKISIRTSFMWLPNAVWLICIRQGFRRLSASGVQRLIKDPFGVTFLVVSWKLCATRHVCFAYLLGVSVFQHAYKSVSAVFALWVLVSQ